MIPLLAFLCLLPVPREDGPPRLYSIQEMQALGERLAGLLWEVEVTPGAEHTLQDPETIPRRQGQAVLLDLTARGVRRLLVSGELVRGWSRITARRRDGAECTAGGVEAVAALDVALIRCQEVPPDPAVPLAADDLAVPGALLFSLDNPAGPRPSVFFGFLEEPLDPPLSEFHHVRLGGLWSHPLLNHRGELVALTLRRLRAPPDILAMAATCRQLRAALVPRRRDAEREEHLRESSRRPFHYE